MRMQKITINGHLLSQVGMRMEKVSWNPGETTSFYGANTFSMTDQGDVLDLRIPPQLLVELYRQQIISQDPTIPIEVKLERKKLGSFIIDDVRHPASGNILNLRVTLKRA